MYRPGIATCPVPSQLFELAAITLCLPKELTALRESKDFAIAQFAGRLVTPRQNRRSCWDMSLVEKLSEESNPTDTAKTKYQFIWNADMVIVASRQITPPVIPSIDDRYDYDSILTEEQSFGLPWLNAVHQMSTVSKADCAQLIQAAKQQFSQSAR